MWLLRKVGLWPMEKISVFTAILYILNIIFHTVALGIVIHNIIHAIQIRNINLLNWMTCVILPLVLYYSKPLTLFINKSFLKSILNDLEGDMFNRHSEKLNRHIRLIYKISNLIIRYFVFVFTTFISIFGVLPIVTNIRPIIPASFPTGRYAIVYNIAHLFGVSFMSGVSTALDVLFMSCMALCGAQLDILEERLTNVLEDGTKLFQHKATRQECANVNELVEHILKECIILHEAINR